MPGAIVAAVVAWGCKVGIVQDGVQVRSGDPCEIQVAVSARRADRVQLTVCCV